MDLSKLPDLCRLLENVCTARDFLLEVGGGQVSAGQIQLIPRRRPGPPCPKCAHVQVVRANGLTGEEFWSCPRFPTCTGKVRVKDYPIYDMVVETLAPVTPAETCQHLRTWKKGSNGSVRRVQCKDCGHVILWEHI